MSIVIKRKSKSPLYTQRNMIFTLKLAGYVG